VALRVGGVKRRRREQQRRGAVLQALRVEEAAEVEVRGGLGRAGTEGAAVSLLGAARVV
jgi:hypothetical protein